MKKAMKILVLLVVTLVYAFAFCSCKQPDEVPDQTPENGSENSGTENGTQGGTQNNNGNTEGDSTEEITPPPLPEGASAPKNLAVDFWELSWDGVDGAIAYVVEIDGKEYRAEQSYLEIYEYVAPGATATIRVEPVYEGEARGDLWTQISYAAPSVTEGLLYTKLNGGTYAVCCPDSVVLEDGVLVLPDTYEGASVTQFRNADNESPSSAPFGNLMGISEPAKEESGYAGPRATKISKVRLPAQLTTIDVGAFYGASIEKIYLPTSLTVLGESAFEDCKFLKTVTNASGLKTIDKYAFSDCSALTEFDIPQSVSRLWGGAFIRSGITRATLPQSITVIYEYTFYGCEALSEIVLHDKISEIYPTSLDNTAWYNSQPDGIIAYGHMLYGYKGEMPENTRLTIPATITKFAGKEILKDQKNLVSATFLGEIESLAVGTFKGCENLSEVVLGEGLKMICAEAFYDCKSLKTITLPDSLTTIGGGAFYGCGLESIVFPRKVNEVGTAGLLLSGSSASGAFEAYTSLREIVIHKGIKRIGARCFYGCTALERVEMENGIERIGTDAFVYCTSLTELTVPDSVTDFELSSIAYTAITHFEIPRGLEKPDFADTYDPKYPEGITLQYVVVKYGTKYLDWNWFYIYATLKSIFYEGTESQFKRITIEKGQTYNPFNGIDMEKIEKIAAWEQNLTIYFYSETEPTEEGNYWHYVDGVPTPW